VTGSNCASRSWRRSLEADVRPGGVSSPRRLAALCGAEVRAEPEKNARRPLHRWHRLRKLTYRVTLRCLLLEGLCLRLSRFRWSRCRCVRRLFRGNVGLDRSRCGCLVDTLSITFQSAGSRHLNVASPLVGDVCTGCKPVPHGAAAHKRRRYSFSTGCYTAWRPSEVRTPAHLRRTLGGRE
jgi:hypothetical protein